jgi:hypothetical protein
MIKDKDGEEEFSGVAGADGSIGAPLTQCVIRPREWNLGVKAGSGVCLVRLRGEHQEIACTPHTVTIAKDGKTVTKSFTMDRKQTAELSPE